MHSSQHWHPTFLINLRIVRTHARPGSSCWELGEPGRLQRGIPTSSGCLAHDENGRAGSGGEHLVLMSWPRGRGHSQIPGVFLDRVFFSAFPTLSLPAPVSCTLLLKYLRTSQLISKPVLIHDRADAQTEGFDHTGKNSQKWKATAEKQQEKKQKNSGELDNL